MVGSKTVLNMSCLHPIRTCFFVTASTRLHAIDCYASHMQKEHTNYFFAISYLPIDRSVVRIFKLDDPDRWRWTTETFRFESEDDCEDEIWRKVFFVYSQKTLFYFFLTEKLIRLFLLKEVQPSHDRKMTTRHDLNDLITCFRSRLLK